MWETSCSTLLHCIPSIANAETPAPDSALEDAMARPIPIAAATITPIMTSLLIFLSLIALLARF